MYFDEMHSSIGNFHVDYASIGNRDSRPSATCGNMFCFFVKWVFLKILFTKTFLLLPKYQCLILVVRNKFFKTFLQWKLLIIGAIHKRRHQFFLRFLTHFPLVNKYLLLLNDPYKVMSTFLHLPPPATNKNNFDVQLIFFILL